MEKRNSVLLTIFLIVVLAVSMPGCVNIKEQPHGDGTAHIVLDFGGKKPESPFGDNTTYVHVEKTDTEVKWSYNYTFTSGDTVWSALSYLSDGGVSIVTEKYSYGILVVSIAGVKNEGDGGRNWQYWVNGVYGDCAVDMKTLNNGDTVVLRFCGWSMGEAEEFG